MCVCADGLPACAAAGEALPRVCGSKGGGATPSCTRTPFTGVGGSRRMGAADARVPAHEERIARPPEGTQGGRAVGTRQGKPRQRA